MCKLSPNIPCTFYFKSSSNFDSKSHVSIEAEGKSDAIIIQMNFNENNSRVCKSFEYLFNNENIKTLCNNVQMKQIENKINQLSVEYEILTQYQDVYNKK